MSNFHFYEDEKKMKGIINHKRSVQFIGHYKKQNLHLRTLKFTGVQTLARFNPQEELITLHIDFEIHKGKAKLILVSRHHIITVCDQNFHGDQEILVKKDKYRLRILGIHADLEMNISK